MVDQADSTPDGCRPVAADVCRRLSDLVRGCTRRRYLALFFVSGSRLGADDGRVVRTLEGLPDDVPGLLREVLSGAAGDTAQWLVCDLEGGECWACDADAGLDFVTRRNRP
jgi:hypothetical protein